MEISGIQKLTLLDYPGELACTLFTRGCNFTCPFCHNSSLVLLDEKTRADIIPTDEVLQFLQERYGKIDGVCITGGEPLMQPDLTQFITSVKSMGYLVKLDTNGYMPDKLQQLIDAHLIDYIAMDVKNSEEKYALTVGRKNINFDKIKQSIEIIKHSGLQYEFRTTAIKEYHSIEDFEKISELIGSDTTSYFIQNFIDSGAVIKDGLHGYTKDELLVYKKIFDDKNIPCEIRGI